MYRIRMYHTCRCTINSTAVSLFVYSLVGGGTHDTWYLRTAQETAVSLLVYSLVHERSARGRTRLTTVTSISCRSLQRQLLYLLYITRILIFLKHTKGTQDNVTWYAYGGYISMLQQQCRSTSDRAVGCCLCSLMHCCIHTRIQLTHTYNEMVSCENRGNSDAVRVVEWIPAAMLVCMICLSSLHIDSSFVRVLRLVVCKRIERASCFPIRYFYFYGFLDLPGTSLFVTTDSIAASEQQ